MRLLDNFSSADRIRWRLVRQAAQIARLINIEFNTAVADLQRTTTSR
jgi:hypothetical protein